MAYNKEWAIEAGKEKFVNQHLHLADQETLEKEFDKLVPQKKEVKAKEPEEK